MLKAASAHTQKNSASSRARCRSPPRAFFSLCARAAPGRLLPPVLPKTAGRCLAFGALSHRTRTVLCRGHKTLALKMAMPFVWFERIFLLFSMSFTQSRTRNCACIFIYLPGYSGERRREEDATHAHGSFRLTSGSAKPKQPNPCVCMISVCSGATNQHEHGAAGWPHSTYCSCQELTCHNH